jgi:hypothetical protein
MTPAIPLPATTDNSSRKGNRRPWYPRESVAYLFLPPRVTVNYANVELHHRARGFHVLPDFKFSTIFKMLHIARLPLSTNDFMASIYMRLGLATDDET